MACQVSAGRPLSFSQQLSRKTQPRTPSIRFDPVNEESGTPADKSEDTQGDRQLPDIAQRVLVLLPAVLSGSIGILKLTGNASGLAWTVTMVASFLVALLAVVFTRLKWKSWRHAWIWTGGCVALGGCIILVGILTSPEDVMGTELNPIVDQIEPDLDVLGGGAGRSFEDGVANEMVATEDRGVDVYCEGFDVGMVMGFWELRWVGAPLDCQAFNSLYASYTFEENWCNGFSQGVMAAYNHATGEQLNGISTQEIDQRCTIAHWWEDIPTTVGD